MLEYPENNTIKDLLAGRSAQPRAKKTLSAEEVRALDLIQMGIDMYTRDRGAESDVLSVRFTPNSHIWGSKYYVTLFRNNTYVSLFQFNNWSKKTIIRLTHWLRTQCAEVGEASL